LEPRWFQYRYGPAADLPSFPQNLELTSGTRKGRSGANEVIVALRPVANKSSRERVSSSRKSQRDFPRRFGQEVVVSYKRGAAEEGETPLLTGRCGPIGGGGRSPRRKQRRKGTFFRSFFPGVFAKSEAARTRAFSIGRFILSPPSGVPIIIYSKRS
jgi:hypothetical protein